MTTINQRPNGINQTDNFSEATIIGLKAIMKGDPGAGGSGASFIYQQSSAATVWTVPHNLNKNPAVTVVVGGVSVLADTAYVDQNIVQITHGTPLTGFVYCN